MYTGLQTIPCTPLQISCSLDSSLVLTTADQGAQVLTFGDNSLRQLGRGDVHANQNPIAVDAWALFDSDKKPLSALHITAGLSHAMAVLCSGQVEYSADLRLLNSHALHPPGCSARGGLLRLDFSDDSNA